MYANFEQGSSSIDLLQDLLNVRLVLFIVQDLDYWFQVSGEFIESSLLFFNLPT